MALQAGNVSQIMNTRKFDLIFWNDNNVIKVVDPLPEFSAVSHVIAPELYEELVVAVRAVQEEKKARVRMDRTERWCFVRVGVCKWWFHRVF
jgi:hypothetical protein